MKHNKLNRETINKILTEYFDETALSDDDAKIILDYHKFDDETLIELALGVVGLAWGTSGRKVVDILDDFDQLNESETFEQTALLLENVLKENKRLGKLLEEKHEEWLELMDEINNQEVLSQKWIDDNSVYASSDGITEEYVHVDDLKELLVPKQEEVKEGRVRLVVGFDGGTKSYYATDIGDALDFLTDYDARFTVKKEPIIPKFIADYIQEAKDLGCDLGTEMTVRTETLKDIIDYIKNNEETFARAWLDGYTVEEEQKYVVKLPMSKNNDNQYAIVDYSGNIWIDALPSKYKLTEEEIRGLTKGDVLFEHFAVKVEELEE